MLRRGRAALAFPAEEANVPVKLQAQIEALENLSTLDAALTKLEAELIREGEALSEKKEQLRRLEERFEITRGTVGDMDRTRGELMQDARHMSLQMDRSREKLSRSRSEREVNAVQREIEELRKLYRDREQEIEKINGLAERARQEMDGASTERSALLGDLGANETERASRLGTLEASVARSWSRPFRRRSTGATRWCVSGAVAPWPTRTAARAAPAISPYRR